MKSILLKYCLLLLFKCVVFTTFAVAQYIPTQIYDLKVISDTLSNDYIYFRIKEDKRDSEFFRRNVYRYNVSTGKESLFIEDFFDDRFGFPYFVAIKVYEIVNNNPEKYIAIREYCDNECSEYIEREDSVDIFGGLFNVIENLNLEANKDSGLVYIKAYGETIIGRDGGKNWPIVNEENGFEVPDTSKIDFPLRSLSPYNDSLMFGLDLFFESDSNAFYKSSDKGITLESLSDTLLPEEIAYDSNQNVIYLIDKINAPGSGLNCSIDVCNYGLYTMDLDINTINWDLKTVFKGTNTAQVHPKISGTIYVWNKDSIAVSEDYGETFSILVNPEEDVTGFAVSENGEYYSTTYSLYKIDNGSSVQLRSIPISNEIQNELPVKSELLQNYPNPFNPSTTVSYSMKEAGTVVLELYDITGRFVEEIVNEYKLSGEYKIRFDASNLSSGTYFIRGKLGESISTQKITLIK